MAKKVITERDILEAVKSGKKSITADAHTLLTPAAQDAVRTYQIKISENVEQKKEDKSKETASYQNTSIFKSPVGNNLIVIGSDHGGFKTKELIKKYLAELGYRTLDIGTNSEEACDYPDYAYAVARIVAKGEAWRGIMIEATGVASAIVCNKIPGIRATACYNEFVAQSSREHNDANVLTLGAKALGEATMKSIIKVFLETWFGGGRHKKRVDKIIDIENKFSKQ
ncbi:MAG: ribose 5-phosphate isomerase B [Bacteroidetes bacterium]|nr:ribose 5-phosphate isomerase B [Bacteroidota bacterium]